MKLLSFPFPRKIGNIIHIKYVFLKEDAINSSIFFFDLKHLRTVQEILNTK